MHTTTKITAALGSIAVAGFLGAAPAVADSSNTTPSNTTTVTVNIGSGNTFSLFNGNFKGNLNGNLKGNLNGNLNHNRLFNGNFRVSRLVHHKAN